MKLCLGTVQFGISYGLKGRRPPSMDEALEMMTYAVANGVDAFDTAVAYGSAEEIVGEFVRRRLCQRDKIQIITKFGVDIFGQRVDASAGQKIRDAACKSLKRLQTDYVDAFLCHVPAAVYDQNVVEGLNALKQEGLARHVGITAYEVEDASACAANPSLDFLQIPLSVLDQRMACRKVIAQCETTGTVVHVRSAFVQGLLLMDVNAVPPHLAGCVPVLREVSRLCADYGVDRRQVALSYVKRQQGVADLVFGVHDMAQLRETISDFNANIDIAVVDEIASRFSDVDANLFMPNKWRF